MSATQDKTLIILPEWSEDKSNITPNALREILDSKPINRSAYFSATGYPFDLEVHQWNDRVTINVRMGEDTWHIYSSHQLKSDDCDQLETRWCRDDNIRMTPQQYEAVTKFIGDIGIDGPTIPTELRGWVGGDKGKSKYLNFCFADEEDWRHLDLDLDRHGDPGKIDRLIKDHRFNELVAIATGDRNAHLNYPHHADLTRFSPQQIEADILVEAAALAVGHELEAEQMQNILKDMSALVLNSRKYKPDYGYQIASGNSVNPQTNEFLAYAICRGEWTLKFSWKDCYYSILLGGEPDDTFQTDEDRAAVVTNYGTLGAIERMIEDSRFAELASASVSAPAFYHHYPQLNSMEGVYPEVAAEMIQEFMSTLAAEYDLETGLVLLEDMRSKVMEDLGEHRNHSYDGLLGITRVPRDEPQQTLPEVDMNAVIGEYQPDTVEESYFVSSEDYAEWLKGLAQACGVANYGPDAIASIKENTGTQVEFQAEPAIALQDTPPIKESGMIVAEDLAPDLHPVDLGTTLNLIDVDFYDDTEYQEDGGCPYLADLQPINMWTNPIDVEVYALPEGWSEATFLATGYTRVTAKLNGHQLYVPNHQVRCNLRYREIQLWYALHPELEIKEYTLDLEVDRSYHDYGEALEPERLTLPQKDWHCCNCNKHLGIGEVRSWGYKAHEYSTHANIYCPTCLDKYLQEGKNHPEYTIVNQRGDILYYHPYYDAFARCWHGDQRKPDCIEAIPYYKGYLFCESLGIEMYSWLPWWQQSLRKLMLKSTDVEKEAADHARMVAEMPGTPIGPYGYRIRSTGQECIYRTYGSFCDAERFINYLKHSAKVFRQLHPEQCIKEFLGCEEVVYWLSHYVNCPTADHVVGVDIFDLEADSDLDERPEWIPCRYKTCYRPGLQQSIQHYLRTGELLEWSPFVDIGLEGTALEVQELGEKGGLHHAN